MTRDPHWAEAYVGRAYVEGRHDCADFVAAVLRERFGRTLALPAHGLVSAGSVSDVGVFGLFDGRAAAPG